MIVVNALIDKINALIASGSLTEKQAADLSKAVNTIEKQGVSVVTSLTDISATDNPGRIVFVSNASRYYISNGSTWATALDFVVVDLRQNAYAWGSNDNGRLGDNTVTSRSSPVSVVGGFSDWSSLSAGGYHSLGIRSNGTLWAWGDNVSGRLGDNTVTSSNSPVSVVGGFTDWIQASAGSAHSLGIRADGTLWAWGSNLNGRLGDNTITSRRSPVSVVGGFTDWVQVSSTGAHSLGVRANGTLWAWGSNASGSLGDNTITSRSSPVSVVGGFTDWIQASVGSSHSLGLRANGTIWAWGYNVSGRLGDNTITSRSSPVSVVGGFTDWTQASAGGSHSLGIRANGTLWAWGSNLNGRLGDGTLTSRSSPVSVVGGFTDWAQISAGYAHSTAIRSNGTAWAWGLNTLGRLGDDTIISKLSPVSVASLFTDWVEISAGGAHTLGVRA
jgi:alpha-tubulin suppressor-like RCC1 family protein